LIGMKIKLIRILFLRGFSLGWVHFKKCIYIFTTFMYKLFQKIMTSTFAVSTPSLFYSSVHKPFKWLKIRSTNTLLHICNLVPLLFTSNTDTNDDEYGLNITRTHWSNIYFSGYSGGKCVHRFNCESHANIIFKKPTMSNLMKNIFFYFFKIITREVQIYF